MKPLSEEIAAWASIVGAFTTVVGIFQSAALPSLLGAVLFVASCLAWRRSRIDRRMLRSAGIAVEGIHLDSLNVANLRRRVNDRLVVHEAYHRAVIGLTDLNALWRYDGYCAADFAGAIEFSLDSDRHIPFDELDCCGFDLRSDPKCLHPIRPFLIGQDGISKKVALPFSRALTLQERFSVVLRCNMPGCFGPGVQYYSSTVSFARGPIGMLTTHLVFRDARPEWLRVYDVSSAPGSRLLHELPPARESAHVHEYIDTASDLSPRSARVYVFSRSFESFRRAAA